MYKTLSSLPADTIEQGNQSNAMEEYIDPDFHAGKCFQLLKLFNQEVLSDLIRDLNSTKKSLEILASRLKEKTLLLKNTKITFYRNREQCSLLLFTQEEIYEL